MRTLCKPRHWRHALNILHTVDHYVDSSTYHSLLQLCLDNDALPEGKLVHAHMIQTRFQSQCQDTSLGNKLLSLYAKCGALMDACRALNQMHEQDVISWTAMIAAYSRRGYDQEALALFRQMQGTGIQPNHFTFASILPAYTNVVDLKELHYEIIRSGFQSNVYVGNALIDRYANLGSTEDARYLFNKMTQRNVVSWTSMISGYTGNGEYWEALKLFRQMQLVGVRPNAKTLTSLLPACANLAALEQGREVHGEIIRSRFQSDVFAMNALVDMYAKCGRMENAHHLFDKMHERNAVSWTAMVAGYAQNGCVDGAHKLFQKMPEKDVLSWTALITGYAQNGHGWKTLRLFREMHLDGVKPNSNTFACVLPACASLAALEQGKEIHKEIIKKGLASDVFVGSAITDMYAKCGSIEDACHVFDRMTERDVVSWTVMIVGFAMHGFGKEALECFEQMKNLGSKPDNVTFLGVLSACCHAGLVDEGQQYFDSMSQCFYITPKIDHYSCIVDLLGRAGRLDEAEAFIYKMPIKPDSFVWGCLLGACRVHNNIELAESVAEHLFELNPKNDTTYVLLSNIYAAVGRWDDSEKVRKMMDIRRISKNPGCSWIEVNKQELNGSCWPGSWIACGCLLAKKFRDLPNYAYD